MAGRAAARARCVDQQAALAGAGCVEPGLVKATYGTGVFVLAHAGDKRPEPAGGLLPTVAWRINGRVEWAIDGGVFTAGALLEWLSRDLGLAPDPAALAAAAAEVEDAGGVRVLPALCRGGRSVVAARSTGGDCRHDPGDAPGTPAARSARGDCLAGCGRRSTPSARASPSRCCASTEG